MASLQLRNVDEELVARLQRRAARHGRSMEAEHREILRQALPDVSFMGDKSFDEMAAELRKRIAGRNLTRSEDLIREGRDER